MKKIFVVNGSPKGINSGTLKVTNAFLEGIKLVNETVDIDIIHLSDLSIHTCCSCLTCYNHTAGVCKYKDDLTPYMLNNYKTADLVIFSFPLHSYGMSSLIQIFIERTVPLLGFLEVNSTGDEVAIDINLSRPDNHKFVYISTCSSTNIDHVYESIIKRMETMYKNEAQHIFCPSTLYPYVNQTINNANFFKIVQWAGQDVGKTGEISMEINQLIKKYTESTDSFMKLPVHVMEKLLLNDKSVLNNGSGIAYLSMSKHSKPVNLRAYKNINKIIQVTLTDVSEIYQFKLTNLQYEFLGPLVYHKPDLTIMMTYDTYRRLRNGNLSFIDELLNGTITYLGEFKVIPILYTNLFASKEIRKKEISNFLSQNQSEQWIHNILNQPFVTLLPWIFSWTIFLFNWKLAGVLGFATALITLIFKKT